MTDQRDDTVFSSGKARWLIQHADELNEDERALLLAMVELNKDVGRTLTDEEHAALDKLAAEMRGFDPAGIQAAVQKMVEGETKRQPVQGWPTGLGRKARGAKKK